MTVLNGQVLPSSTYTLQKKGVPEREMCAVSESIVEQTRGQKSPSNRCKADAAATQLKAEYGGEEKGAKSVKRSPHLPWRIVRTVPEFDLGVEGAAICAEIDVHLLHRHRVVRPRAERAALDEDGVAV